MHETPPDLARAEYYVGLDHESPDRLGGVDGWMEVYDTQAWIEGSRKTKDGLLDIDATAAALDVPLRYDDGLLSFEARIYGVSREERPHLPIEIVISNRPGDKRLPFGHEVGHLFLERATSIDQSDRDDKIEAFCEEFGRCMVLTPEELIDIEVPASKSTVLGLMERYKTDHHTVLIQLMLAGKLPRAIALDTRGGDVPNQYYANKVHRHVVCLDCALCKNHEAYSVETLPVYDFTDYTWSDTTPYVGCSPRHDVHDNFRALNMHYGTWDEQAEAMHEDEKKRSRETRELLADYLHEES